MPRSITCYFLVRSFTNETWLHCFWMLFLQGAKHPPSQWGCERRDAEGTFSPIGWGVWWRNGIFQEFHLAGLTSPTQWVHCIPSIQVSSKRAAASLCTVWKIFNRSHFGPDSSGKCDLTPSAPEQNGSQRLLLSMVCEWTAALNLQKDPDGPSDPLKYKKNLCYLLWPSEKTMSEIKKDGQPRFDLVRCWTPSTATEEKRKQSIQHLQHHLLKTMS